MHPPSVASPPRPPVHRVRVRAPLVLGVCSALLVTLVALRWHPLMAFDGGVSRTTHRWAVTEGGVTQVFRILTDWVWDPLTMRLLCAAVAVWLVWRRSAWRTALWLVAATVLATLLQQGLKAAVDRPRPVFTDPVDSAHYAAFPSGHAMTATVVCGLLLWLLHRHGPARALWRAALAVGVLSVVGVGLTRIWLGVHWPSDVLGGWLLGAWAVWLATAVYGRRGTCTDGVAHDRQPPHGAAQG